MEDIKDFDAFYALKIEPYLEELNRKEGSAVNWGYMGIMTVVFGFLSFAGMQMDYLGDLGVVLIIFFIGLLVFCIVMYTRENDSYVEQFKEKVIRQIIDFLNLGLSYKPEDCISIRDYKASGLYRHNYEYYDGNDFLEGIYKNVPFQCSEIITRYDSPGMAPRKSEPVIFKGLFFVGKVNASLTGGTYVWTRGAEQLPSNIMDEEYRMMYLPPVQEIRSSNQVFQQCFSVYTTYPSQAREIITPEMQNMLLLFRNQIRRNFQFSVVAGKCFVAIPFREDLLEPVIDNDDDKEVVKKHFFTILLMLSIINQLNLRRLVEMG